MYVRDFEVFFFCLKISLYFNFIFHKLSDVTSYIEHWRS